MQFSTTKSGIQPAKNVISSHHRFAYWGPVGVVPSLTQSRHHLYVSSPEAHHFDSQNGWFKTQKKWLDHLSYPIGLTYMFIEKKQTNYFWWYSQVWPNPFRSFSDLKFRLPRSIFLTSLHVWRNPARLIALDHNMCVYDIKTTYSNVICLWFTSAAAQGGGRSFKDRTL